MRDVSIESMEAIRRIPPAASPASGSEGPMHIDGPAEMDEKLEQKLADDDTDESDRRSSPRAAE